MLFYSFVCWFLLSIRTRHYHENSGIHDVRSILLLSHTHIDTLPFASAYFPNCTSLSLPLKTHQIYIHSTTRRRHTTHLHLLNTLFPLLYDKVAKIFRWKWTAKILRPERGSFLPGVFLFFLHCDETVGVHFLCMQTTFIVAGMCVAFFNFSSVLLPCPPAMPLQFKPHTTRK